MSKYQVKIARRALRVLATLARKEQQRVRAAVDLLAEDPRPPGCTKLSGEDSAHRARVGDNRIVYEVIGDRLLVHVVRIGHRREVYRT